MGEHEGQSVRCRLATPRLRPFREKRQCVSSWRMKEGRETVPKLNHRERVAHPTVWLTDIVYRPEEACRGLQKSLRQPQRGT